MTGNGIATNGNVGLSAKVERVLVQGDLGQLTPEERVSYYNSVCESVGLNPLTRPFDYVRLNGKEQLYAKRDATDQLRAIHRVSITIAKREVLDGVLVVTAQATTPDGRTDESVGAVPFGTLKGEAAANAYMKAETKAKRRVTLSICGLGWLDETDIETIPAAQKADKPRNVAELKAALKPATPAQEFDAEARAIAESAPPPSVASPDDGPEPPPDVPLVKDEPAIAESETPAAIATRHVMKLEGVNAKQHLTRWENKYRDEVRAMKDQSPADYERVIAAWNEARTRVA